MPIESMWTPLVAATAALSSALLLVALLRVPIRRVLGARTAYASWLLVPVSLLALCVPAPTVQRAWSLPMPAFDGSAVTAPTALPMPFDPRAVLVAIWLLGAFLMLVAVAWRQSRWSRLLQVRRVDGDEAWRSSRSDISPMVFGLWRTRIVLPADFEQRFDEDEQRLVRTHEHMHLRGQDVRINALATLLLAFNWFNPLAWWSWRRFRFDQELACDALVIERHPRDRRIYANAMLKAQLDHGLLPLGCHWSSTHPLHRRIAMLARKSPTSFTRLLGRVTVAAIALSFSYSIWAQKPAHTENIDQAPKKGDMLVFFTATVGDNVLKQVSMPGADGEATIRQTVDNEEWLVDFVVQPKPADRFVGTFKVTRNGELQGHPTLEWQRDGSASMSISNDAGETQFAMDVRATVLDKDMPVIDSNIREASTAPREAHTLNIAEAAKSVEIIRQVDGSYRLDNLPKGLSAEEYRVLMEEVDPRLRDTMQKNGDAPEETEASKAKPAAGVSPVSIDFHPAWQIDFMAQANPPDQC